MARSSRHKSHKQSKHASKDDRVHSGSEEVKIDDRSKEGAGGRSSKDANFSDRRKPAAFSRDCEEMIVRDNINGRGEFVTSKRREVKNDPRVNGRWNGRLDERKDAAFGKDATGEVPLMDFAKSMSVVDSRSKSKRARESPRERDELFVDDKEKNKTNKQNSKHKPRKELKEGDRGALRERKVEDNKDSGGVNGEAKKKWDIKAVEVGEEQKIPRAEKTGLSIPIESRNPELERELDKRIRRRASGLSDRDKYHEDRHIGDVKRALSKDVPEKDAKYRDDRNRHDSFRDREGVGRRESRHKEDGEREKREKCRDDRRSKDHIGERSTTKHARDEVHSVENVNKKSRGNHDRTPAYEDKGKRYRDESDSRSRSIKEQGVDGEKRSNSCRVDMQTNRGRSHSRHADHDKRRSSFSPASHDTKDKYRQPKRTEYKDIGSRGASSKDVVPARKGVLEDSNASSVNIRCGARASKNMVDSGMRGGYHGRVTETRTADEIGHAGENSRGQGPFTKSPSLGRAGIDSPSVDEDFKGKSNKRPKRLPDPTHPRTQSNTWKGIPGWQQTPVTNGFIPFPHGPPMGFHPMMQQFPPPPVFGRPPMELNSAGVPFHIPDSDKFPNHASRPFFWRGPIDGSYPPFHFLEWDHNRADWGWDANLNMWRPIGPQKDGYPLPVPPNEQNQGNNQVDIKAENGEDDRQTKVVKEVKRSVEVEINTWHVYLAKLDISRDLTRPEIFEKCRSVLDKKETEDADDDLLRSCVETDTDAQADAERSDRKSDLSLYTDHDSIFKMNTEAEAERCDQKSDMLLYADHDSIFKRMDTEAKAERSDLKSDMLLYADNDSIFKRAMNLYKKQKEENNAACPRPLLKPEKLDEKVIPVMKNEVCEGGLPSSGTNEEGVKQAVDNARGLLVNVCADVSKVSELASLSRIHQSTH